MSTYSSTSSKSSSPLSEPATHTLPSGQTCSLTIKHLGSDKSDNSSVSFEVLNELASLNVRIGMDDNPLSGCQNNLQWDTVWSGPNLQQETFVVSSLVRGWYSATNALGYGFELSSSDCLITNSTSQCTTPASCGYPSGVGISENIETTEVNERTVQAMAYKGPSASTNGFAVTFTLAKDNPPEFDIISSQDEWEKSNPALNIDVTDEVGLSEVKYCIDCNTQASRNIESNWKNVTTNGSTALTVSGDSIARNVYIVSSDAGTTADSWDDLSEGSHTIYLRTKDDTGNCTGCDGSKPFTVKKDSIRPTAKITRVEDAPGNAPGFRPDFPSTGDYSAFLNAYNGGDVSKTWWFWVDDADGGSGVSTCYISVNGTLKPQRSCNGWVSFKIGKPGTGADCTLEGHDICRIKVWVQDNATNITTNKNVNIITANEENYVDGLVVQDANEFTFGIDWTPPTAQ